MGIHEKRTPGKRHEKGLQKKTKQGNETAKMGSVHRCALGNISVHEGPCAKVDCLEKGGCETGPTMGGEKKSEGV